MTIRGYRQQAGFTLRGFAEQIGISATFLSDIEKDRRLPSDQNLRTIARELAHVGASFDEFDRLNPRVEPELQEWVSQTPEARQMLRTVFDSGRDPREVLRQLEDIAKKRKEGKKK